MIPNEGISVPLHNGADVSTSGKDIFEGGGIKQNPPCILLTDTVMIKIRRFFGNFRVILGGQQD